MRKIALVTIGSAAVALCLSAACSGETNTITQTVYVTVTAGGSGGEGGGTAGTGGTQGTKATGEHCKAADECAGGLCFDEESTGLGLGYCSTFCNAQVACPNGETCVDGGTSLGTICLIPCDPAGSGSECKTAQACLDMGDGTGVCWAGCTAASDCPIMGSCDTTSGFCSCTDNTGCPTLGNCEPGGYCAVPEICNNQKDDDSDGLVDCEDADDCATDATCATAISDACSGAVDVSAGGSFDGNTVGGTNTFAQTCSSLFGSYIAGAGMNERVYKYTAADAGTVGLKVQTSAGSVDWYVRTACSDDTTNQFCATEMAAADSPVTVPVAQGDTLYIFVDGYNGDATFTLDVTFSSAAAACAAATAINLGTTNGDNTAGTQASDGTTPCQYGTGPEKIYVFTPAASGNLTVTLTPTDTQGDPVLYARSVCADAGTQLANGCADIGLGGDPETITIAVTNGTPVYIFADSYAPGPYTLLLALQ